MKNIRYEKILVVTIRWLLLVMIVIYVVTGYGITQFRTVDHLTFGLLTKPEAFRIHNAIFAPFVILLVLHVTLNPILKFIKRRTGQR